MYESPLRAITIKIHHLGQKMSKHCTGGKGEGIPEEASLYPSLVLLSQMSDHCQK